MYYPIGKQYIFDDSFKAKARFHQSTFRSKVLQVDCDVYGSKLLKEDAQKFLNFYHDLGISETVKERYPRYSKGLYADMLRSEHIPFNVFAPFKLYPELGKAVLNSFLTDFKINTITSVKIEHAPFPSADYLKDRTSFDTYIEFISESGSKGFLGIEVKYTEKAYKLKQGSTEEKMINNSSSPYNKLSNDCNLFIPGALEILKSDEFRQVWRNQLLGESMLVHAENNFKHFASITFYPKGNKHFEEVLPKYIDLLNPNHKSKIIPITFEAFFEALSSAHSNTRQKKWIDYLRSRYLF